MQLFIYDSQDLFYRVTLFLSNRCPIKMLYIDKKRYLIRKLIKFENFKQSIFYRCVCKPFLSSKKITEPKSLNYKILLDFDFLTTLSFRLAERESAWQSASSFQPRRMIQIFDHQLLVWFSGFTLLNDNVMETNITKTFWVEFCKISKLKTTKNFHLLICQRFLIRRFTE